MNYLIILVMMLLSSCSLAPDYHRPPMAIPSAYKESKDWKVAKAHYADRMRGKWWEIFADPVLNELEDQVSYSNQNVMAAIARYEEACAASAVARSQFFPTIDGAANASRVQTSGNVANKDKYPLYSDYFVETSLSYELDVFGRVRNSVAAADNLAHASAADLAAVDLSMHAAVASNYFALRGYEDAQRLLDKIVIAYDKAYQFTLRRYHGAIASIADVDAAKTQLDNARTLATDMRLKQSQIQHAIAVLIGKAPANFSIAPLSAPMRFVAVPPEMPSLLLQRRPDIAAAVRRVEAANAEIGVARAAFFPSFNLSAVLGLESDSLKTLFAMPSLVWSLGPSTALALVQPLAGMTLFDGGKLRGLLNEAKASYNESVANYRQTVLSAFQDVEDNLAAQRRYAEEYSSQNAAAIAANGALEQVRYRYLGGIATILDIVVAENIALQTELSAINIKYQRQITSVQLIRALGGGWEASF